IKPSDPMAARARGIGSGVRPAPPHGLKSDLTGFESRVRTCWPRVGCLPGVGNEPAILEADCHVSTRSMNGPKLCGVDLAQRRPLPCRRGIGTRCRDMRLHNRFLEQLGVALPIIQAPMAGASGTAMAI